MCFISYLEILFKNCASHKDYKDIALFIECFNKNDPINCIIRGVIREEDTSILNVKCFRAETSCKIWWIYFHCVVLNIVKKDFALKISAIHLSRLLHIYLSRLLHIYLSRYITTQCHILREKHTFLSTVLQPRLSYEGSVQVYFHNPTQICLAWYYHRCHWG